VNCVITIANRNAKTPGLSEILAHVFEYGHCLLFGC
jgi:hypothetical protein